MKECSWVKIDVGFYGCQDIVFKTQCGHELDAAQSFDFTYCPECGGLIKHEHFRK